MLLFSNSSHEAAVQELRKNHSVALEALNEQLEQFKKAKIALERAKGQQDTAMEEVQKQLQSVQSSKYVIVFSSPIPFSEFHHAVASC